MSASRNIIYSSFIVEVVPCHVGSALKGGTAFQTFAHSSIAWERLLKPFQCASAFFSEVLPGVTSRSAGVEFSGQTVGHPAKQDSAKVNETCTVVLLSSSNSLHAAVNDQPTCVLRSGSKSEFAGCHHVCHSNSRADEADCPVLRQVLEDLSRIASEVMGTQIEPATPMMAAGLDSLAAVELRNAVTLKFGVQLPATVAFDYPTLAALANFVTERLPTSEGIPESERFASGANMARASNAARMSLKQQYPLLWECMMPSRCNLKSISLVSRYTLCMKMCIWLQFSIAALPTRGVVELANALASRQRFCHRQTDRTCDLLS